MASAILSAGLDVLPHLLSPLQLDRVTRQQIAAVAATSLAGLAALLLYARLRKRPSAEEIELARRSLLGREGRIIDGSIVGIDGSTEDTSADGTLDVPSDHLASPQVLIYRYRIAGVTYECAQDVSMLPALVRHPRIDLPIQVRYEPRNPGNSIVVAEEWSGLQLAGSKVLDDAPGAETRTR